MTSRHRQEATPEGSFQLRLRRIQPGEQLHVKVLSDVGDRIMGLLTHWKTGKPGHSEACVPGCPASLHNSGTYWKGYLAAEVWQEPRGPWVPCVFEVTEALELDMRGKVRRGQTWLISRALGRKGSKEVVSGKLKEELPVHAVSLAFELRSVLWSVYHCCAFELDTPNTLPDRVYVRPVAAPGPGADQAGGNGAVGGAAAWAERRQRAIERGVLDPLNGQAKHKDG